MIEDKKWLNGDWEGGKGRRGGGRLRVEKAEIKGTLHLSKLEGDRASQSGGVRQISAPFTRVKSLLRDAREGPDTFQIPSEKVNLHVVDSIERKVRVINMGGKERRGLGGGVKKKGVNIPHVTYNRRKKRKGYL